MACQSDFGLYGIVQEGVSRRDRPCHGGQPGHGHRRLRADTGLIALGGFDEYLGGKTDATPSADEQRGLQILLRMDVFWPCQWRLHFCTGAEALAGASSAKFGINGDYWKVTCGSKEIDKGHAFSTTKRDTDLYVFKEREVPTPCNVEMTPPYFHDGSVSAHCRKRLMIIARQVQPRQRRFPTDEDEQLIRDVPQEPDGYSTARLRDRPGPPLLAGFLQPPVSM